MNDAEANLHKAICLTSDVAYVVAAKTGSAEANRWWNPSLPCRTPPIFSTS
jgi:hypothetical protein